MRRLRLGVFVLPVLLLLYLHAVPGSKAMQQRQQRQQQWQDGGPIGSRCDVEMQVVICSLAAEQFPEYHKACCVHWQHTGRRAVYGRHRRRRSSSNSSSSAVSAATANTIRVGSSDSYSNDSSSTAAYNSIELVEKLAPANSSVNVTTSLVSIYKDEKLIELVRPDLDPDGALNSDEPNYLLGRCTNRVMVKVPAFLPDGSIVIKRQRSPRRLSKDVIFKTKAYVMSSLRTKNLQSNEFDPVKATYKALRSFNRTSGFIHPGGVIGPGELALMQHRLADNVTLQELALKVLLTGVGVPPKTFNNGWKLPTDTPVNYAGPYAMTNVSAKYGGTSNNSAECPDNYPVGAPRDSCAHISLVELDAQMSYKQALAYWATGNDTYAENALRIIRAWASNNREFGDVRENGPLEAGWAVSSFARAMELLRDRTPEWNSTYVQFTDWMDRLLMPQMDEFINSTKNAIAIGKENVLNNWQSTIAEAWMAVGVLTNNPVRYRQAVTLYHATVRDYMKWGRGLGYRAGRVVGETSETLRDIFHTQFGLGGLLQVAEMAWQQDMDLYSAYDYAMVAAMELHARIILANDNETTMPQGFKLLKDMPKAPAGTVWALDFQRQIFYARNRTTGAWVKDLNDGVKYLQGITFLPTAWEVGYNHYVGRLGLHMPETAALMKKHYVDWYAMHWGGGTLSHANTAQSLWRAGLRPFTVCPTAGSTARVMERKL